MNNILIRYLGLQLYEPVVQAMHKFTYKRSKNTLDEIWLVEHYPVFTQGNKGKAEHILRPGNIPVIQSDRGGQVTYHGPGQQVMYVLLDLKRRKLSFRKLVMILERTVINTLAEYNIHASLISNLPGVYVEGKKICSLGLRIINGCSLHGFALNIDMDLAPFLRINPCGCAGIEMTQMCHWIESINFDIVSIMLVDKFLELIRNTSHL